MYGFRARTENHDMDSPDIATPPGVFRRVSVLGMNLSRLIFEFIRSQLESRRHGNERDRRAYVFILAVCRLRFCLQRVGMGVMA